eukprot:GFKZ01008720.1.p2 GENE.GFKZ01008720.1~~GFKZ01008720.1.p2  ORF type:complete len:107 (+),score=5.96 GFKZ01008720.1:295-615(+)
MAAAARVTCVAFLRVCFPGLVGSEDVGYESGGIRGVTGVEVEGVDVFLEMQGGIAVLISCGIGKRNGVEETLLYGVRALGRWVCGCGRFLWKRLLSDVRGCCNHVG